MTTPTLPALECDLVMKGGLTSGMVYPSAVSAIARQYRLRSIGGTSAGAIAAAAAAAMEFGRASGRNPDAAQQLEAMPAELGAVQDGRSLLQRLFAPDPATRKIFGLLLELQALAPKGWPAVAWRVLRLGFLLALLLSPLLVGGLLFGDGTAPSLGQMVASIPVLVALVTGSTLIITLLVWVPLLLSGLRATTAAGFGFCSGMAREPSRRGSPPSPSLGDWLHAKIQALAGLPSEEPLCFGDLWAADHREAAVSREQAFAAAVMADERPDQPAQHLDSIKRAIELALVASDVTRAQSIEFPFLRREDRHYVRLSDLEELHPCAIVDWMRRHAGETDLNGVDLGGVEHADLIRLPAARDLPVLFAVRPSLSYPLLFRAVRLYVIRGKAGGGQILSELWLTDGGVTSNFPIHLFDAPIPARPTFAINLLYADDELLPDERSVDRGEKVGRREEGLATNTTAPPDDLVYMLRTNSGRVAPYTGLSATGLGSLLRFVLRVMETARQWNDNQLLDVPGYRDRIVHVRMREGEGGFSFDMDAATIADLQRRGTRAGEVIAERYLPTAVVDPLHPGEPLVLNWANHRMARFRSFVAGLEVTASSFAHNWRVDRDRAETPSDAPGHAEPSIEIMAEEAGRKPRSGQAWGYPFRSIAQGDLALNMVKALEGLAALPGKDCGADYIHGHPTSPRPKQRLVLRPPAGGDPLLETPSRR